MTESASMGEPNPYQVTMGPKEPPLEGPIEPQVSRALRRCRIAVLVLGVLAGLASLGKLMFVATLLAASTPEATPESFEQFLDPSSTPRSEERLWLVRMQLIVNFGAALLLGWFAGTLFHFAWRCSQCAAGRLPVTRIVAAQNACWYTAALLAVAFAVSNVWVW